MFDRLQSTFDLIAAQTARANGHALRNAVDENFDLLRVRSPGAARLAVGVAHVVSVNKEFPRPSPIQKNERKEE